MDIFTQGETAALVTALGFIVLDYITGVVNAVKSKELDSTIMREGLYHKFAEIMIIGIVIALNYSSMFFDLGIDVPLIEGACVYIIIMELASVLENLCKINPELADNPLFAILNLNK